MNDTRSGECTSAQIGKMGEISNLSQGNFALEDGQVFNIKNDGEEAIVLSVQLAGMNGDDFVETRFDIGWNPEIVKVVKQNASNVNLKWGY